MIRFADTTWSQIQSAADKLRDGDTLCLCGTIAIDNTIVFQGLSDITIMGMDLVLNQTGAFVPSMKFYKCINVNFKDFTLYGRPDCYDKDQPVDSVGILMEQCGGKHKLDQVTFRDHGSSGFRAYSTSNVTFNRCKFDAAKVLVQPNDRFCTGVHSADNKNEGWHIQHCTFKNLAIGGLFFTNQNNTTVTNCKFQNMRGQHGLYFNSASSCKVYDNEFEDCYVSGVKFQLNTEEANSYKNINIKRNIITHTDGSAQSENSIGIATCFGGTPTHDVRWSGINIMTNEVSGCRYGVLVDRIAGKVQNNVIRNCKTGLRAFNSPDAITDPNLFDHCEQEKWVVNG